MPQTTSDWPRRTSPAANRLLSFSDAGAGFVFGNLYKGIPSPNAGEPGWSLSLVDPSTTNPVQLGFVVAFHVLPVIIFLSSLLAILYHIGLMQRIVAGFAWIMRRTMKISGAESLATAANIFVGNVESPLAVRPYIEKMTMSELALIMTSGFATVAGSVMATYIRFGVDAGHLLTASIMSAPAAVVVAKLIFPETAVPETADTTGILLPAGNRSEVAVGAVREHRVHHADTLDHAAPSVRHRGDH